MSLSFFFSLSLSLWELTNLGGNFIASPYKANCQVFNFSSLTIIIIFSFHPHQQESSSLNHPNLRDLLRFFILQIDMASIKSVSHHHHHTSGFGHMTLIVACTVTIVFLGLIPRSSLVTGAPSSLISALASSSVEQAQQQGPELDSQPLILETELKTEEPSSAEAGQVDLESLIQSRTVWEPLGRRKRNTNCEPGTERRDVCERCSKETKSYKAYEYCCQDRHDNVYNFCKEWVEYTFNSK